MSDGEQWRFQWPDGTWIRWNPQTQSWEKEAAPSSPAEEVSPTPEPVDVAEETVPEAPEPVLIADGPQPEVAEAVVVDEEEPLPQTPPAAEVEPRRPRHSAQDVLPPQPEPERPGGSLWPTIVAGAIVGVGVGLVLFAVIR